MRNRKESDAAWNQKKRERRAALKKKRGAPSHVPTDQSRALVRALVVAGWRLDMIGPVINVVDPKTLRKHYRPELDLSRAQVDAKVTQTLVMMATGGEEGDWKLANPEMVRFYARTRLGWKEPKQDFGFSGAVGQYDLSRLSEAELKRAVAILERAEISAPTGDESGAG